MVLVARLDDKGQPMEFLAAPSRKLATLFIDAMAIKGERYSLYKVEEASA